MNKPKKLRRKEAQPPSPDFSPDITPEDQEINQENEMKVSDGLTSKNAPNSLDMSVTNFLKRYELLEQGYTCTIYKYDDPIHGKKKSVMWQGEDEFKTENEIGLEFGSGRFLVMINAVTPNGQPKIATKVTNIHAIYDQRKYEYDQKQRGISGVDRQVIVSGGNGGGDLNATLGMLEKIITLMLPLIVGQRQAQPDFTDIMSETYKSVNKTMRQMLLDNSQLFNDLQRENFEMGEVVEDESEVSGLQTVINTLAPILENALPLLMGGGQKSVATVKTVKALPLFKQLTKTQKGLKTMVSFIDQKHGKEVTEKLLSKFKIKRP